MVAIPMIAEVVTYSVSVTGKCDVLVCGDADSDLVLTAVDIRSA